MSSIGGGYDVVVNPFGKTTIKDLDNKVGRVVVGFADSDNFNVNDNSNIDVDDNGNNNVALAPASVPRNCYLLFFIFWCERFLANRQACARSHRAPLEGRRIACW